MDLDFEKDIVLENARVLLRPVAPGDVDHLLHVATEDPKLLRYSPTPVYSHSLLSQYIEGVVKERQDKVRYPFIIFDKQLKAYAGCTSFLNISHKDRRLEIGSTWIGNHFQRTGLNRNCKFLLLSYAFDHLGFERVELKTDERNMRSRTAIEKIGGRLEGTLRSHTVMSDGFRRNTFCYSILAAEWPEIRQKLGVPV